MLRVRNVTDIADFAGSNDDAALFADLWESDASLPEWCFVIEDGSQRLGRIGFRVSPTTSEPDWLGSLPPHELFTYGFDLPWEDPHLVGATLLAEAAGAIAGSVPSLLEVRILDGVHDHPEVRSRFCADLGMDLFSEKAGFQWLGEDTSPSDRLVFRSVAEIGVDDYRRVMAPCGAGTLDRNDRYYWEGCGPENWAAQISEYLDADDADLWLVGYDGRSPVGYVAVARDEDLVSTIAHIGVIPEHRGQGYISDLLATGTEAARSAGISEMLSDVDVLNQPMTRAMVRGGHLPARRPWHVWAYRIPVTDLASVRSNRPSHGPFH